MRIALCEDDPMQIDAVLSLLAEYQKARPDIKITADAFTAGQELLTALESGNTIDVFLLDILMPGFSGIDLARELRLRGEAAPLIFLTTSADYVFDAFDVSAMHYILKPIRAEKLFPLLDKAACSLKGKNEPLFIVNTSERVVKIPFSSIVYVESICRKLHVYLTDGSVVSSKTMRMSFSYAIGSLLSDARFHRAHNSFVVNLAQIHEITGTSFNMSNGMEVPIPRYKHSDAKKAYLEYMAKSGGARNL